MEEKLLKTEEWLNLFRKNYDIFENICSDEKITICYDKCKIDEKTYKSIYLDLYKNDELVHHGVHITVDDDSLFDYLIANTISYILLKKYSNIKVNIIDYIGDIKSNEKETNTKIMLRFDRNKKVVEDIISAHNNEKSTNDIIEMYKSKIKSNEVSGIFLDSIKKSNIQFLYVKSLEKKTLLKKS